MKNGKLAYRVDDSGQRLIDPAELQRWASDNPTRLDGGKEDVQDPGNDLKVLELRAQLQAEQIRVAGLQERLADKDAMLGDLREDRDRWRSQAERLVITDQREKTKQAEPLLARLWGQLRGS